jgi:internalin A
VVTDGIYHVLNDDRLQEQRHGQLAWSELARILPRARWSEKCHLFLVELMRKFELCFPLEGERETELVPELLPDKTPSLHDWNPTEGLVFLYRYSVRLYGVSHASARGRIRKAVHRFENSSIALRNLMTEI